MSTPHLSKDNVHECKKGQKRKLKFTSNCFHSRMKTENPSGTAMLIAVANKSSGHSVAPYLPRTKHLYNCFSVVAPATDVQTRDWPS